MNDEIKKLVFQEVKNLDEALEIPLCRKFYNQLASKEGTDIAKRETLSLYNESRWLACQELLSLSLVDPVVLKPSTNSHYYDTNWLLALKGATNGLVTDRETEEKLPVMMELLKENADIVNKEDLYLNDWGYPDDSCPITYAPLCEWGDLSLYDWEEMTAFYNKELLDQLYSVAKNNLERKVLYETLNRDAKISYGKCLKEEDVYMWLCKVKIDLQERGADKNIEVRSLCEQTVLNINNGTSILDVDLLRRTIQIFLKKGEIPNDNRSGYVWYAVWLFFKKNNILKDSSQSAFYRLMDSWFPDKRYGKDDLMRNYNSSYLEKYNWQIWKFEEFKKTSKKKTSERGFEQIKKLYKRLESTLIDYIGQSQG